MSIIHEIYSKFPQIEKVICYGSRAKGNFREGSDIDMTIVANAAVDVGEILSLFDDSLLPYLVDVSDFSKLKNQNLIDHITRRGKILYERKIETDHETK